MTRPARLDSPLPGTSRVGVVAALLAVAGACWVLTATRMSGMGGPGRMDGMGAGPGTDRGLGWFSLTWVLMMAAMMLPSLAPMVLAYAGAQHAHRSRRFPTGATVAFVAGYLVSWSAAGLVGYLVVEGVRSLDLGFLAWNRAGPYVAGGLIVGAALYQLTRLKGACLRHCRTPPLLVRRWRPGLLGALRTGIGHGAFCIGCGWALMTVLFIVGLMSLGWMAVVAALVAVEKLLPWQALAYRGVAVGLAVLGIAVAVAPFA